MSESDKVVVSDSKELVKESSIESADSGSTVILATVEGNVEEGLNSEMVVKEELNSEEVVDDCELAIEKFNEEEFSAAKDFYITLKGYNRYDVTPENYIYWRKTPGVGKGFKEYIESASLLMIMVQFINERRELARLHDFQENVSELKKKDVLFAYLKRNRNIINKYEYDVKVMTPEFVEFKTMCHLKRFGYLRNYLKDNYNIDANEFRKYDDVKNFFKINKDKK